MNGLGNKTDISGFVEKKHDTGEVLLNYVEGSENNQPIILIPGQSGTWESYDKVLEPLSKLFKVYAVDVRGHGKSTWTPGEYTFNNIGQDFTSFIKEVVKKPVIISGNSSGGLIALWLASNKPELVKAIILEDAPLFSADWPRIKKEFVYEVLRKTARFLGSENGPDYEGLLKSIQRPKEDGKISELPDWLVNILVWVIKKYQKSGEPIDIPWFPRRMRLFLRSVSMFDPDFARSWVDGRIYEGLNHENALSRVKCPVLVIHADWYRTERGLVGAMDDKDAERVLELVPQAEYVRLNTRHVTHSGTPEEFVSLLKKFHKKIDD